MEKFLKNSSLIFFAYLLIILETLANISHITVWAKLEKSLNPWKKDTAVLSEHGFYYHQPIETQDKLIKQAQNKRIKQAQDKKIKQAQDKRIKQAQDKRKTRDKK